MCPNFRMLFIFGIDSNTPYICKTQNYKCTNIPPIEYYLLSFPEYKINIYKNIKAYILYDFLNLYSCISTLKQEL